MKFSKLKISLLGAFLLLINAPINARLNTTILGKEYNIDTLRHVKVGPGTYQTSLLYSSADGAKVFRGFFLTMDMKGHDNVEYRMELGNDSTLTVETISGVAKRKTTPNNYYFAGVNGDFYLTWNPYIGTPHAACHMNGQIAGDDRSYGSQIGHFIMDRNKNMWCDYLQQGSSFTKPDNSSINITRINYDLYTNEVVLFNSLYGHYTKTSSDATELAVRLAPGETWKINEPVKLQVVGVPTTGGNMRIEPNGAVISTKGTGADKIADLKDGDEITLKLSVRLGNYQEKPLNIKEVCGGDVVILKRGEVEYNGLWYCNGIDNNNPRTMLGYNEDRSKMVWGLIDGRSTISTGCTYPEGAVVMKLAGCYDATNVDGGGSAGMYVQNLGIVNVPSDGKERAVSNGIFAVLNAPEDNNIAEINFVDFAMQFPKYGVYTPKFYGYNQYGMLIDTDIKGVVLSCDEKLGSIKDNNTFVGNGSGTYALKASYNGITTSIPVTIIEAEDVNFRLNSVINDTYREYPVEVQSKMNEVYMPIDPAALSWSSEDANVATVTADGGVVKGIANGKTTITGTIGDFTGSIIVNVEKPTSKVMAIDPEMDITTWMISQTGGKNIAASKLENGMELTYTGASGRGPNIKLTKESVIWSLPDAIRIRINPGDAPIKKVTINTRANEGGVINTTIAENLPANTLSTLELKTSDWCDSNDLNNFPLKLNYILFEMGTSTTGTEYKIEIPGIEAVYNAVDESGIENVEIDNSNLSVYPNPVNAGDMVTLSYNIAQDSMMKVFNEVGMLVAEYKLSADGNSYSFSTKNMERGSYIISIQSSSKGETCKLIIK